ncbi:MAG: hypothetical protein WCI83_09930, partial [Thermoleophilia bacterium]
MARLTDQRGQAIPLVLGVIAVLVAGIAGTAVIGATRVAAGGARLAADLAALSAGRALLDGIPRAMVDPWNIRRRLTSIADAAAGRSATASGAQVVSVRLLEGDPVPTQVEVRVRRAAPMGLWATATARAGLLAVASVPADGPVGWATGGGYSGPLM